MSRRQDFVSVLFHTQDAVVRTEVNPEDNLLVFCCYFKLRNPFSHCSLENSFSVTLLSLICNYPVYNYQMQISYSVLIKYRFIRQGLEVYSVVPFVFCEELGACSHLVLTSLLVEPITSGQL